MEDKTVKQFHAFKGSLVLVVDLKRCQINLSTLFKLVSAQIAPYALYFLFQLQHIH